MIAVDMVLHQAIATENVALSRALISAGANVNSVDDDGNTPLHLAISAMHARAIKLLLQSGADPNTRNNRGDTPLHWAAGIIDWPSPVRWMLQRGADVNLADSHGRTALHHAARERNPRILRCLLKGGSSVHLRDHRKRTALHHAVLGCCPSGVSRLLRAGADPRARDAGGNTPLHFAARINWPQITQSLLGAGARLQDRNYAGVRPIEMTVGIRRGVGAWPAVLLLRRQPRVARRILQRLLVHTVRRASQINDAPLLVECLLGRGVSPFVIQDHDFWLLVACNRRENKFQAATGFPPHTIQVLRLLATHRPIPASLTALLL